MGKRNPNTPTATIPSNPNNTADTEGKPLMPTQGEEVHYRGAIVDMCCQSRDFYRRIKFPKGTIKSYPKVMLVMCIYVRMYNRILYMYADDDAADDDDADDDHDAMRGSETRHRSCMYVYMHAYSYIYIMSICVFPGLDCIQAVGHRKLACLRGE